MSKKTTVVLGIATSTIMALGTCGTALASVVVPVDASRQDASSPVAATDATVARLSSGVVRVNNVQGAFAFSQGTVDDTATIAKAFAKAPSYLCGGEAAQMEGFDSSATQGALEQAVSVGSLRVTGEVQQSFTASLEDLAAENSHTVVMGCACGGNPADGRTSVTASVTGVLLRDVLQKAQVNDGVNTIVFTSIDGYEVALPLTYVAQRCSMIVYAVNGESVQNTMGGSNQLWLGSTSARYFARDIVSIELRTQDEAPAAPGAANAADAAKNVPNVTILSGTSA